MKKKIILRSIVIILIILNVLVVYLLSKPDKNRELEDIKVIDLKRDNSIAIMVQDTEGDGWHEQEDRSKWPSPTTHGFVGAKCTDSEGAEIDYTEILQFNLSNYTAEINTKNSVYCTLYFAKGEPALDKLSKKGGSTFNSSTSIDGMYRYKGTATDVTNNYICFGTTDEAECLKSPETYMYRIIGITSEADDTIGLKIGQLKLIKALPSNESQRWGDDNFNTYYGGFDSSEMKTYLNTTFYNATFVTEATKIPNADYWEKTISSHKWYDVEQKSSPSVEVLKTRQTAENKIGLMYGSDYINAGATDTSNWLFIKNGWVTSNAYYEWTMTRYGSGSSGYYTWIILGDKGSLSQNGFNAKQAARPVFYLQSGVNLTGEGTKEHPYIITTMNNA